MAHSINTIIIYPRKFLEDKMSGILARFLCKQLDMHSFVYVGMVDNKYLYKCNNCPKKKLTNNKLEPKGCDYKGDNCK